MRKGVLYLTVFFVGILTRTAACNVEISVSDSPTNITSPGYPRDYPSNLDCWWKVVTANSEQRVTVEVVDIFIESCQFCNCDKLSFYDGWNSSAPKIGAICGSTKGTYITTGNTMFIRFTTDSSQEYRGFLLKAYQTHACGGELMASGNISTISSPGYPNSYFSNMKCIWVITTENENDTIVLRVDDSQIEEQSHCAYDSVTIYNGNMTISDPGTSLGKYCGDDRPSFRSSGNSLTIVFVTDGSVTRRGFSMHFLAGEATSCNMTMSISTHPLYFVSPGYPNGYYNDMVCVWHIISTLEAVNISVVTSNIEDSFDCVRDSVTVYSGTGPNALQLGSFCGNSTPTYRSRSWYMTVVFKTDDSVVGKGFRIRYQNGLIPTTTTTTTPYS